MAIVIPQTKSEVLPEGVYLGRILEVTEEEGQFGKQLKVTFVVAAGPHEGVTLRRWYNAKFSPKSALYDLTKTALGLASLAPDRPFCDTDILGKIVGLLVKVKTSDKGEFNKIESVFPAGAGAPASATASPAEINRLLAEAAEAEQLY